MIKVTSNDYVPDNKSVLELIYDNIKPNNITAVVGKLLMDGATMTITYLGIWQTMKFICALNWEIMRELNQKCFLKPVSFCQEINKNDLQI
jgi:hypothetical protein